MEIFYSRDIDGNICRLDEEESVHCVKVLRHREGDGIHVIDGEGTLYNCRLLDASPKAAEAEIVSIEPDWGSHPYFLQMVVCPTKNADRYEWFAEKATELGVDVITPAIGDHSERKVFKTDRLKRILLSASKQSLKGAVPQVEEPVSLSDFIRHFTGITPDGCTASGNTATLGLEGGPRSGGVGAADVEGGGAASGRTIKLIACCYEGEEKRISIDDALKAFAGSGSEWQEDGKRNVSAKPACQWSGRLPDTTFVGTETGKSIPKIVILIGPEGDFSREEVALALECGFKPVHLGPSRLRTETAALAAVAAVYFHFCSITDCYTDD